MRFTKSLRWRIQIWHGLLLVAVLTGFGWTAYRLARDSRLHRTDEDLQHRLSGTADSFRPPRREGPGRGPAPPPSEPLRAGEYEMAWGPGGAVLLRSDSGPADVPKPTRPEFAQRPPARTRGEYREWFLTTPPGDVILVGRSMAADFADLRRLAWLLSGTAGVVLVLGLGGGWWLASGAIQPLGAITDTAGRIAAGNLWDRIDVADTDTELGHLASILNATFSRLEEVFAQQAQFTADAAHELRTPVSIVISQAQLGLRGERTAPEYREMLDACLRAARRMQKLIDSLLELARFDAGGVTLQRRSCDLADLARESAELFRAGAQERGVALALELAPAPCEADTDRLAQVVTNLLANALEHTPAGGCIALRTGAERDAAVLSVADTGPGIAPADVPRIFDRFYRADLSRTRRTGGAGLGLAICKTIAEAHGGALEVTSELGKGSAFTLRLRSIARPLLAAPVS